MLNTDKLSSENIASDYLTTCFSDLDTVVRSAFKKLEPHAERFEGIVVRGMSGLLVGPMVASLLKKPWCVVRKPGEGTHSYHKSIEGWRNFKSYIIVDDLIATGGTVGLIQRTVREHALAYPDKWERGLPECVGIYLYNHNDLSWRSNGKNYSHNDKYFLSQEIPARPSVSDQIVAAIGTGQNLLTDIA